MKITNTRGIDHESMDVGGDGQSVNFLTFMSVVARSSPSSASVDIYDLAKSKRTRAREVFMEYGPIPRLCINYVKDESLLDAYQNKLNSAISGLTMDSLLSYVQMGENLDFELSHSIILVKRRNVDNLFNFNIEPISPSVDRRMKRRPLVAEQEERLLRRATYSTKECTTRG